MPVDPIWWLALALQLVALPGTLLPVLPGLLWLPVGAGLWCWHVGWSAGWPPLLLAAVTFALGLIADLLAVSLATARLQAGRWSAPAAVVGLGFGLLAGGFGVLIGPWLMATVVEAWSLRERSPELGWNARAVRSMRVGLAVVAGLLVSQVAQLLLTLIGAVGFVLLTAL